MGIWKQILMTVNNKNKVSEVTVDLVDEFIVWMRSPEIAFWFVHEDN